MTQTGLEPPRSLLGPFSGARPPAPAWFEAALAQAPERSMTPVEGADIETLAWGRRGDPGMLLLPGFGAHADWWSFIAPLLADDYRVAALSVAGMGGSGWREHYDMDQFAREAAAAAEAGGLFDAGVGPLVVGHSFGSFITRILAQTHGDRLSGAVLVDGPLSPNRDDRAQGALGRGAHRIYPTLAAALARFRFAPSQTCEHLYIADHIARTSLKQVVGEDGQEGWTWRFDGALRSHMTSTPLTRIIAPMACPHALIFGERSQLMTPERADFARQITPAGTPWITVPDAGHHVMADQPLALVAALRGLLAAWPAGSASS